MITETLQNIQTNAQADPMFTLACVAIFLVFIVALGFASKGI